MRYPTHRSSVEGPYRGHLVVGRIDWSRLVGGEGAMPRLSHTCILTRDSGRLRSFYHEVLGSDPRFEGDYASNKPAPVYSSDDEVSTIWALHRGAVCRI